jgi:FixJ family two-component response regulator
MKPLQAIILDDEYCSCERLKKLLTSFQNVCVANCFTNSQKALGYIFENRPDVLFLDVELANDLSGFEILDRLDSSQCRPYVIMVTGHPQYSIKAIKHEVFDYIVKPIDIDELKITIDRLVQKTSNGHSKLNGNFPELTGREREILQMVLAGAKSEEIAERLYISLNTVNTHRRKILKKTGARSVFDLFRMNNISHA